jgi:hypothetical protein
MLSKWVAKTIKNKYSSAAIMKIIKVGIGKRYKKSKAY